MFKRTALLLIIMFVAMSVSAQSVELSAVIRVIGEDILFERNNTNAELPLSDGVIAPFGIGDRIRTEGNGRVLITIADDLQLLVLPNSEYQIVDLQQDEDNVIHLEARQSGIVLHDFNAPAGSFDYQLETEQFSITQAEGHFLVWNVSDGLGAVTVASGELILVADDVEHNLSENTGFSVSGADEVVAISEPLHASQVVGIAVNCEGVVNTGGSEGLRLRAGAALDYQVVDILRDGQAVQIVGTTENGLWYRLPFQTGFGWIFSSLIDAACGNLVQFPNLFDEAPERIIGTTEIEIELLMPFYGTPETNFVFYR